MLVCSTLIGRPIGTVGIVAKHHYPGLWHALAEFAWPVELCTFVVKSVIWMAIEAMKDDDAERWLGLERT